MKSIEIKASSSLEGNCISETAVRQSTDEVANSQCLDRTTDGQSSTNMTTGGLDTGRAAGNHGTDETPKDQNNGKVIGNSEEKCVAKSGFKNVDIMKVAQDSKNNTSYLQ